MAGNSVPCDGTGQDGDIRAGMPWPQTRFVSAGSGIISDQLTGLAWAADANLLAWRDAAFDNDGIPADGRITWQHALDYIKKLNTEAYLGFSDWRLPNLNELSSLQGLNMSNNSTWLQSNGFNNVMADGWYWSSTSNTATPNLAWIVNFGNFGVNVNPKSAFQYLLPVRGNSSLTIPATGQQTCYDDTGLTIACIGTAQDGETMFGIAIPVPRYNDNGDGTISDLSTGLVWSKNPNTPGPVACNPGVAKNWQQAQVYVQCLNSNKYLGHDDWRAPNIFELRSLFDLSSSDNAEALTQAGFSQGSATYFWSSNTSPSNSGAGLVASLDNGKGSIVEKWRTFPVWPVRLGEFGDAGLTIDTPVVDFGSIEGAPGIQRRIITIGNRPEATNDLVIRTVSLPDGSGFAVNTGGPNPCPNLAPILAPGETCSLEISFDVNILGPVSSMLTIGSFNTATPLLSIPVHALVMDTTAPTAEIITPVSRLFVKGGALSVTGTATDAFSGVASVEVSTDNGATWVPAEGTTNWSYTSVVTDEGARNILARAKDNAGNLQPTPSLSSVTVDATPPTSAVLTPLPDASLSRTYVVIAGTAQDIGGGISRVEVSFNDGNTWKTATGTTSWQYGWTVSDDVKNIQVRAVDMAGNIQTAPTRINVTIDRILFNYPDSKYPIIFTGQQIMASVPITSIDYFTPAFGAERKRVNPASPLFSENSMTFVQPGEYYLLVNGKQPLKVLVLSTTEPISEGVVRIFDFSVANMVYLGDEDMDYYINKSDYISDWMTSAKPARLSCGPTHEVLATLVKDRFLLPHRKVTFQGVFNWLGRISYNTHNIVEFYLPDRNKWVVFDVNFGFMARWLSAMEVVNVIRSNSSADDTAFSGHSFVFANIHAGVPQSYMPKGIINNQLSAPGTPYSSDMLTNMPISFFWWNSFRFYYSGAGYWGGNSTWAGDTGTQFLPGDYIQASKHTNPILADAVVKWVESFGIKPTIMSEEELTALLDAGAREQIEARAWLSRVPVTLP